LYHRHGTVANASKPLKRALRFHNTLQPIIVLIVQGRWRADPERRARKSEEQIRNNLRAEWKRPDQDNPN